MPTPIYFEMYKPLLVGSSDWFQILHVVTDHSGEFQRLCTLVQLYLIPPMFHATVSQSSNVVIMEKSCIYLHYVIKYNFFNPEVCELY